MEALEQLAAALEQAKAERRQGTLDERGFYARLLELSAQLVPILVAEAQDTQMVMKTEDIRKQIPLVLAFLEDQIARFRARETAV